MYVSGFAHNAMFSDTGPIYGALCASAEHDKHNSRSSNHILLNDKQQQQVLIAIGARGRSLLSAIALFTCTSLKLYKLSTLKSIPLYSVENFAIEL